MEDVRARQHGDLLALDELAQADGAAVVAKLGADGAVALELDDERRERLQHLRPAHARRAARGGGGGEGVAPVGAADAREAEAEP